MAGVSRRTLKRQFEKEMSNIENHLKMSNELRTHEPSDASVYDNVNSSEESHVNISGIGLGIQTSHQANTAEHSFDISEDLFDDITPCGSECSESDSDGDEINLVDSEFGLKFLSKWAVDHSITHSALGDLLKGLKTHKCFQNFPLDPRTLLKTPRITAVREVKPGYYCHFGLASKLEELVNAGAVPSFRDICLQFNIDGLPLYKSSRKEFWPILGFVSQVELPPFVIGLYAGEGKPASMDEYLKDFVFELSNLLQSGLILNTTVIRVVIGPFVCDAPARALICCIKSHTGYYGCGKCTVKGQYIQNRVVFLDTTSPLRTDFHFRTQKDLFEDHHNGISPLEQLGMDMVQDMPYEYMHLVCLGVVKKMILLWMRGKRKSYKLSSTQVDLISNNLMSYVKYIPSEFGRKPRSLREIDRWKATEFRQFLLYTGPLAIKNVVSTEQYNMFLCLHVAIRILVSEVHYLKYNSYAESLLVYFVQNFGVSFGEETVSYNVHGLIHLASDSKRFGPLDSFSAFKFENKLGMLKRLVRKTSSQLQQVHRRLAEEEQTFEYTPYNDNRRNVECIRPHSKGPLPTQGEFNQYKMAKFGSFTLSHSVGNNAALLDNGCVIIVKNIIRERGNNAIFVLGYVIKPTNPFYKTPCNSSVFDTFYVTVIESELKTINAKAIVCKGVLLPANSNGQSLYVPLIHRE